jgi:hypothetical protein
MLALGVIRESDAENFSQVHLEPKPDGSWRFTVDYRILNECSSVNQGFPLPNIKQLLHRLGEKKAKFWGKIDLTSGFHQTELAPEDRHLAAFICLGKVYEPTRVQMGLKNAPSYFQRMIATRVLRELVGDICEIYIDDIIIWGATETEYKENLEKVFTRLREHNITINPRKVDLCLTEVEFLGHLLKPYGLTMSEKKIQKVINFKKPETLTELNSFLGLANYFRDFVPDFEVVAKPLRDLADDTTERLHAARDSPSRKLSKKMKNTQLIWPDEASTAWDNMKEVISKCETLYFIQDKGKIILFTDASDYAYGAYLCQEDEEGRLRPIALMSHTFKDVQSRWSTYDKEGYAIFRAFQEFKLFIRDRHFTLKTDHLNLLYIGSDTSSSKVQRWKLFMQDYDFDVEHIEGKLNVVADGLSRFVFRRDKENIPSQQVSYLCALQNWRPLTPEVRDKIKQVHCDIMGHHGVERTIAALESAGDTWIGMRSDVRQFLRECPTCQKLTYDRPEVHAEPETLATSSPNQRLYIDTIGPLPPSHNPRMVKPYTHILVIMDSFTRYVNLYALESAEASEAADCLRDYFAQRRSYPKEIVTDNGSQFINQVCDEYFKHCGIERPKILAYSHEQNGLVERVNKEVMRHLRAFIYERRVRAKWHEYIPYVQKIINCCPHTVTRVAPIDLQFPNVAGDTTELQDYLSAIRQMSQEEAVTEWNKRNIEYYRDLVDIAAKLQQDIDAEHLAERSQEKFTIYEDDSWVLALPHRGRGAYRAQDDKTKSFYSGPYQVKSHLGNAYVVWDPVQDKLVEFHVTSLKPFVFDAEVVNPKDIKLGDAQEFEVAGVVDHEFRESPEEEEENAHRRKKPKLGRQKRTDLFFKIHWAGYDENHDSWEPWSGVKDVDKVQEYCFARPELKRFLSKEIRNGLEGKQAGVVA